VRKKEVITQSSPDKRRRGQAQERQENTNNKLEKTFTLCVPGALARGGRKFSCKTAAVAKKKLRLK
jgi:hypothetical protein